LYSDWHAKLATLTLNSFPELASTTSSSALSATMAADKSFAATAAAVGAPWELDAFVTHQMATCDAAVRRLTDVYGLSPHACARLSSFTLLTQVEEECE
jgi:hypothetical protein